MRKIKLFIGICFVICVGIESCFAQSSNLKFDIYGPKNGLSDSNVTTVLEDQYGFIWIGTENGLNLYDGYSFTTFRNNADDPGSINHNWVRCLLEDNDKNIWVGTSIGLDKFNRDTNTFDHFPIDPNNSNSFPNAIAKTLLQDSKGNLWIGTSVGISIYRKETNDFLNIQGNAISQNSQANALKGTKVSGIEEDESGRIWIGTDGGLSMTTNLGKSFTHYSSSNDNNSENTISSSHVNSMYLDSQNRLWIGFFDQGIDLMDLNSGSIVNYSYDDKDSESLSNNFVQAIVESKKGEIWIATDVGLNLFHSDGTFSHVRKDQNDEFSLSSDITMSLMIDDKDNMWVGTRLGGVCFYDNDKYRFGLFRHNYDDPNSLSSNNTSGFAEDKFGNLAIATDGTGINFYNKNTNDFTFIKHDPNDNNSITNNKVLALEYDDKGGLWIGMWNGGVNYYNPVTGKIKRYKNDPNDKNSLPTNHIFDLFQDRKGNVWIGTWGSGLVLYRSETDDFTSFFNESDEVNSQRLKGINHIVEDEVGNLWIADEQAGLVVFNYETGDVKHYVAKGGEGDISNICTYTILIDRKKRVWVGTNTGGLNLLNKETDKFTAFTKKDGLPSDDILGLLEDDAGYIWASTKLGLSKIDPKNMTFKNYDERDGLQSNQFMHRNRLKLSTGELVFGGNNGFNKFNPKNLKDNEIEPPVFITNFKLFNKTVSIDDAGVLKKSITFTDELVLNYDQNFFSFEYLGLNFKQTEKNQYKYIMDGLQDEWVDAGSERKVAYTNMNPGKYTFKVKAANNDGLWSSEPVELKIEITPPYWSTWWFRSLAIISLISLIFWLYKRRLKQLMLDKQLLEQKVKEATERVISQNSELKVQSELLQAAIEETNFVVEDAIASGNFKARIDLEQKTGAWKALGGSVNQLFETVARPLNAINTIVNHMADGDLRERYREEAKGDILILAENLNQAMDNLSGLLADISNQTEEIGDSANDMLESSQEMNSSTGEIASAISEMSAGAQDQVMKIDESSGLIEAILGASNEMGDQAESINSAAKMGVEKSDDGIALISKVDHSMKDILAFSIQTDQSIATLTEKAQDISSVLRIIKEIAAQTNLLALNAAIEAAQAGDAGRGFSVVAEEIRKLAEDSKKSAGEIESLISEVQKGTKSTAELVGVMSDNIKQCEAATTESMTTFESITKYYDQTLEKSEQIVTATKQQTGDIGNVLAIISGIVVIAEETAAGTEQTASSSSELSVGMMNYTQKSKQVSDITKELKGRVDKFKL